MNEKDVEEMLERFGKTIEVNEENKKKLRKVFEAKKNTGAGFYKKYISAACIALLLITAAYSIWFAPINKVQADALRVQNYMTYMEVEGNYDLSVAEYKGILYIPNVQEGIFRFDGEKETKIYTGKVSLVKISPNGSKLVFYEEGNIGILDLGSSKSRILLQSDSKTTYESPSWFGENAILYTKHALQDPASSYYDLNNAEIYKLNLDKLEQTKITEGINATYIASKNALLFQKRENIIVMSLEDNIEKVIDQGEQPVASPEGKEIAYTKLHIAQESIRNNIMIEKVLQNLWVADGVGYGRKTMITTNIILEDINQEEWLKNLKPSEELQILSLAGRYCYLYPTWSSDSKAIYTLRRNYSNNDAVVVKIELGKEELSAKNIVVRYLQSIIFKDEDYQSSLIAVEMKVIDELKSNKLVNFKIIKVGKEGLYDFVDAELNFEAAGRIQNHISQVRFYLSKEKGQYYIINLKKL